VALKRTYRLVDGEQIEGTARPVFIRNGDTYFLTELRVFADGVIDCWDWVDLDGLREKLRTGWVATSLPPGARASAHHLASWRFSEPQMWVTAEQLLGEVADDIDTLNGRPDSTRRCHLAPGQVSRKPLGTRPDRPAGCLPGDPAAHARLRAGRHGPQGLAAAGAVH
jgi:hypothetical protein